MGLPQQHVIVAPVPASRPVLVGIVKAERDVDAFVGEQDFERRVLEATVGADLVNVLTAPVAYDLLKSDKLYDFLFSKTTIKTGEKRKVLDILQGN